MRNLTLIVPFVLSLSGTALATPSTTYWAPSTAAPQAPGAGLYVYFIPAVSLLTGPVFFFENEVQPGQASSLRTVQLDIDLDLLSGSK